jgi:hypothetical protein
MHGRGVVAGVTLLLAGAGAGPGAAAAQGIVRQTAAPFITAEGEEWLRRGEPIVFGGSLYYPAGPTVFFEHQRMVRSGWYRGIPLYSDVTLEPFSVLFVPVARGLMRPYERPRVGPLAGTTGSRTPAFPVSTIGETARAHAIPPVPDTGWPIGLTIPQAPAPPARADRSPWRHAAARMPVIIRKPSVVIIQGPEQPKAEPRPAARLETIHQPVGLNAIWIVYRGDRWFFTAPSVRYLPDTYEQLEDYEGFPLYRRRNGVRADRIYVEVVHGLLAPYERRGASQD